MHLTHYTMYIILFFAFILCIFCSASETSVMTFNRYRLKHLSKTEGYAKRILKLLSHPDRLLGAILIGNTLATTVCASLFHQIAEETWGDVGAVLSPIIVTFILLVFAEVLPKTLAVIKTEALARFVSLPLQFMLWLLYPLVRMANGIVNTLLKLFGLKLSHKLETMSYDELRTIVHEAGHYMPSQHQNMLLSILDLGKIRVEHIMIPRNDVIGIDLNDSPDVIMEKLKELQHTLLPVYRNDLDNVQGILHTRNVVKVLMQNQFDPHALIDIMDDPYFVPEGTSLQMQLLNFQQTKRRMGLVVDEYGEVLGLITLEDILEEIVGEFTTAYEEEPDIQQLTDGTYLIDGSVPIRELNRTLQWDLPTEGPTTLNGLIIETLESIPDKGTFIQIAGYSIEVVEVKDNAVRLAKIYPTQKSKTS